jgi:hypothetical protein
MLKIHITNVNFIEDKKPKSIWISYLDQNNHFKLKSPQKEYRNMVKIRLKIDFPFRLFSLVWVKSLLPPLYLGTIMHYSKTGWENDQTFCTLAICAKLQQMILEKYFFSPVMSMRNKKKTFADHAKLSQIKVKETLIKLATKTIRILSIYQHALLQLFLFSLYNIFHTYNTVANQYIGHYKCMVNIFILYLS